MNGKILLIHASDRGAEGLHRPLVAAGYAVVAVTGRDAGLRIALRDHPDLVLVDTLLPNRGAVTVCQELKRRSPDLPVVLHGAAEPPVDLESSGCTLYLETSPLEADLLETLRPWLPLPPARVDRTPSLLDDAAVRGALETLDQLVGSPAGLVNGAQAGSSNAACDDAGLDIECRIDAVLNGRETLPTLPPSALELALAEERLPADPPRALMEAAPRDAASNECVLQPSEFELALAEDASPADLPRALSGAAPHDAASIERALPPSELELALAEDGPRGSRTWLAGVVAVAILIAGAVLVYWPRLADPRPPSQPRVAGAAQPADGVDAPIRTATLEIVGQPAEVAQLPGPDVADAQVAFEESAQAAVADVSTAATMPVTDASEVATSSEISKPPAPVAGASQVATSNETSKPAVEPGVSKPAATPSAALTSKAAASPAPPASKPATTTAVGPAAKAARAPVPAESPEVAAPRPAGPSKSDAPSGKSAAAPAETSKAVAARGPATTSKASSAPATTSAKVPSVPSDTAAPKPAPAEVETSMAVAGAPPSPLQRVEPVFSREDVREQRGRHVVLRLLVDEQGVPVRVLVKDGVPGSAAVAKAIDAALRTRYAPAKERGKPVSAWVIEAYELKTGEATNE